MTGVLPLRGEVSLASGAVQLHGTRTVEMLYSAFLRLEPLLATSWTFQRIDVGVPVNKLFQFRSGQNMDHLRFPGHDRKVNCHCVLINHGNVLVFNVGGCSKAKMWFVVQHK